jgi:hypothetical protein
MGWRWYFSAVFRALGATGLILMGARMIEEAGNAPDILPGFICFGAAILVAFGPKD